MKRLLLIAFAIITATATLSAETAQQTLNRAIDAVGKSGIAQASYVMQSQQMTNRGTITLSGSKFRIISNEMKCWYDGKTMWAYSTATGEVNITEPTADELAASYPYVAATRIKDAFRVEKAKKQTAGSTTLLLTPKKRTDIKQITMQVADKTGLTQRVVIAMRNGQNYNVTISNYKTRLKLPAATFTFDKSQVPTGTDVVDLR